MLYPRIIYVGFIRISGAAVPCGQRSGAFHRVRRYAAGMLGGAQDHMRARRVFQMEPQIVRPCGTARQPFILQIVFPDQNRISVRCCVFLSAKTEQLLPATAPR